MIPVMIILLQMKLPLQKNENVPMGVRKNGTNADNASVDKIQLQMIR